jgi:hypothetical protein
MQKVSRRKLIVGASAGAAGIGLIAGVPALAERITQNGATPKAAGLTNNITAFITTADSSHIVLLVGEKQVMVKDQELIARLVRAAQ